MRTGLKSAMAILLSLGMVLDLTTVSATQTTNDTDILLTDDLSDTSAEEAEVLEDEKRYIEGEVIVLYDNPETNRVYTISDDGMENIKVKNSYKFGAPNATVMATSEDEGFTVEVLHSDTLTTEEMLESLKSDVNILYAEPNYIVNTMSASNDLYSEFQWNLYNTGQNGGVMGADVNIDLVPENVEGVEIIDDAEKKVIAIIDSGVDYTHEDLAGAMWTNPFEEEELAGVYGYDFYNGDDDPMDDFGHGTRCAGIMVAGKDNGVGVAGIASRQDIKLMALKAMDSTGAGSVDAIVAAYNYIYTAQQLGVNVVAINNSWGFNSTSDVIDEMINKVGAMGAISVCAAGNALSNNDKVTNYPSNSTSPYVIAVAATNEKDELATFSNYGPSSVDIAAPGVSILSTTLNYDFVPSIHKGVNEICEFKYDFTSGNLVQTLTDDAYNGTTYGEGDIPYGIDYNGGNATITADINSNKHWGSNDDKSLEYTIKNAKYGDTYYIYLPYTVKEDNQMAFTNAMVTVEGPAGSNIYNIFTGSYMYLSSMLQVSDGALSSEGAYDADNCVLYGTTFADNVNYWSHAAGYIGAVSQGDTRALGIKLVVYVKGDYVINVDDFALSSSNIQYNTILKYEYDLGTSMAAPHVTAAVALLSSLYPENTPEQIVERTLKCARPSDNLAGKVKTGGVLDLSYYNSPIYDVFAIDVNEDNDIVIEGTMLSESAVTIDGNAATILERTDDYIIVDGEGYLEKNITLVVQNGEASLTRTRYLNKSVPDIVESELLEINGCQISTTVEGYRVVYSVDMEDVTEVGMVYGLASQSTVEELYVGSINDTVYSYAATELGKLETNYGVSETSDSYAMTMSFIKTAEFYNSRINIRAYAKLSDGSYVYSSPKSYSVYEIADYLYENECMTNETSHNYLYDSILSVASLEYEYKAFDVTKSFAKW